MHIMFDERDKEEHYHILYMKTFIESVGMKCKPIEGVKDLSFKDGCVID